MHTIETTATVTTEGTLTIQVPQDIPPGPHYIIVLIDAQPTGTARPPLQFAAYPVGLTAPERPLRRDELYDDIR